MGSHRAATARRTRAALLALLGIGLSVAAGPLAAGAGALRLAVVVDLTLTVDDAGTGADDDPGDGVCATSGGVCTVRAALQEADETAGTGEVAIAVPAGTFPLGGPATLARDVRITGAGRDATTIDVGGGPGISVADAALALEDLEITGGLTTGGIGGSAVTGDAADVTFTDARLRENHADGDGGAVLLFGGSLVMTGTEATSNSGQTGGAVHATLTAVLIDHSTFAQNSSSAGGGAVHLSYPTSVSITDSSFVDNTAVGQGGAVSIVGFSGPAGGVAKITGTTFDGNLASADGGALYVGRLAGGTVEVPLVVDDSTFTGNSAEVGGAVALDLGTLTVTDSTFEQNRATAGAGGAIAAGGPLTVGGSSFTENSASEAGGAIAANGPTTITGSDFTGNHAGTLGGALDLFGVSTPVVTGNTFEDNVADVGAGAIWRLGTELTQSGNTFQGNSPAGEDVKVGVAPTSDRQVPTTTSTTVPPGGTTTTPPGATTTTAPPGGTTSTPSGTDPGSSTDPGSGSGGAGGGSLARTGVTILSVVVLGVLLLAAGVVLRRLPRRSDSSAT